MKFKEYAMKYLPKINHEIQLIFDKKLEKINNSFLKDYYSELKDYFLSGGKRIRPLMCIAAYNAFSGEKEDQILKACVGTEFLHNASLVHDDIIDKDDFRRGKPSFHYRFRLYHDNYKLKKMVAADFGNNLGILGGDSSFFFGLEAYLNNEFNDASNIRGVQLYEQAYHEVCDGVLIEIDMVNRQELSISDYIEMISLKTGALIEKSTIIGANYANVEEKYQKLLSTYAINLGILFQIIDDILGTFGDEKVTGKPTDGDIREGKKTALLIEARNKLKGAELARLNELIKNPSMTDNDVEEVRDLFQSADVINSSKQLALKYYEEATEALNGLKPVIKEAESEFFEDLLNFVYERKF